MSSSQTGPTPHPQQESERQALFIPEGTALTGEPISVDELLKLPAFQNASRGLLEKNRGAVVIRRFKAGSIVCREGEFGSTAFYILEGSASVYISTPMAHVKSEGGGKGFFARVKSRFVGRKDHKREDESTRSWIPIDASVDLPYDNPRATLSAGDLFGEMTCMNFYPRSATVRAETDCVMLEMLRNVLDILQKDKDFKAELDLNYRRRVLENHLRSVPMFSSLTDQFFDYLKDSVELQRYTPGQVICKQGDKADSFFIVRLGFVKVTETHPGGELVLAYLSRGNCFGEMALLEGGTRTATCVALDHVEVVRMDVADFNAMIENFPQVKKHLETLAQQRRKQNAEHQEFVERVDLDDFLAQGLAEAQSLLVLDLNRCTRCDDCVRACAEIHDGVTRLVREGLRFENFLVATSCRQCRDPLCMVGCPVGSIRRRNSLEIIIEDWCIGCGLCAKNCPYGNITLHPVPGSEEMQGEAKVDKEGRVIKPKAKEKATTCDLCYDHAEPACVYACPHDAAHRVDPSQHFFGVEKEGRLPQRG